MAATQSPPHADAAIPQLREEAVESNGMSSWIALTRSTPAFRSAPARSESAVDRRRVHPHHLVTWGGHWYLLAWDLDRDDWRSFRLDRMRDVRATTWTFGPRQAPDAREYVARSVNQSPYRHVARVRFDAPASVVADRIPPSAGTVEPLSEETCLLTAGADHLDHFAVHLTRVGVGFTVLEPSELGESMRRLADTLRDAADRVLNGQDERRPDAGSFP